MHILFYYPNLNLGGQQTQLVQISEALKEMGHKVSFLYQFEGKLSERASKSAYLKKIKLPVYNQSRFGIIRILKRWAYHFLGALQIKYYCNSKKVDVILSSNTPDTITLNKVSKATEIPHFRMLGGSMKQVEPHWLEKYERLNIDSHVDGYFGWPAVFDELKAANISKEKFIEMPFAVNTKDFFPLKEEIRKEKRSNLGIQMDTIVIGWIGRVAKNMQIWNTVELVDRLVDQGYTNIVFLCIGGGDEFEYLKRLINERGLEKYTILTDWIPYNEMNTYINCMDIIPLLEDDPQGGSIIREAMACGRVALSVDGISGTQSWFMKEECAILVKPENYLQEATDKIIELIEDKEYLERLGKNARNYVDQELQFKNQASIIVESTNAFI